MVVFVAWILNINEQLLYVLLASIWRTKIRFLREKFLCFFVGFQVLIAVTIKNAVYRLLKPV
jgi:hypothetical protein